MHCVEDGVEVRPVRVEIFRVLVLQVLHDFAVSMELGKDVFDSQLIILGHSDKLAFGYGKQRFLPLEDLAHEVAIDGGKRWHI